MQWHTLELPQRMNNHHVSTSAPTQRPPFTPLPLIVIGESGLESVFTSGPRCPLRVAAYPHTVEQEVNHEEWTHRVFRLESASECHEDERIEKGDCARITDQTCSSLPSQIDE
jgi:hypothetical protein